MARRAQNPAARLLKSNRKLRKFARRAASFNAAASTAQFYAAVALGAVFFACYFATLGV